jgi:hypothetical protein
MKSLCDLTVEDLRTTPVWISHGGPDEKALTEPTTRTSLTETERETFLVVTEFVLGNGQKCIGFCSPVDNSGLDYIQPVIVTEHGQVSLWFNRAPTQQVIADQWSRLGITASEVFPIHYKCLVPVDGHIVKGVVSDFESMSGTT